jgi:catechol 2,3-dioxygenase-like lactoylglutathione lyase family enzyme
MLTRAASPRLHHIAYAVDDLQLAAERFARTYGIGPFLAPPQGELACLEFHGEPCTWEHAVALAAWGDTHVEIVTSGRIEPPALARRLGGAPRLAHVGYRVDDLDAAVAGLVANGAVPFLDAEGGPLHYRLLEDPVQAAYIELQQDHPALRHMDEAIARAAADWDGREPLRSLH